MSATAYGWLVLAFPLAGALINGIGFRALRGRAAGGIGTAAVGVALPPPLRGLIGLPFLASLGMLIKLLDVGGDERHFTSSLYDYASAAGLDIHMNILVDPLS